jgi:hypothetical protein
VIDEISQFRLENTRGDLPTERVRIRSLTQNSSDSRAIGTSEPVQHVNINLGIATFEVVDERCEIIKRS